ncbi:MULTISPECIES: extracellular solute-binding protein [Ensifer]|uniref:Extracellular solute-binding protein n=2 Tax=Ensifer TaxID=106591 RepID=A0AAW4FS59_9HYPH|nr:MULTISPECIES: extracellular solute-binding protein [Ensifer]MDP9633232.1 multiple sugar transport system substrate-binding protein [Ensifer adhaerens]PSS62805.1 ABC transporter substrate-binding protein [Ensifer sp. NM-2]KQU89839.1 ABC transporter substrate-binding protein [Ensifer sp. Root31]KQY69894.1 ABC transporter substrate-binding protein [Ensifer sp. Root142]MBD9490675.1 extracellular solute-binding protein [Ensifer sp. ENS11]
MRRRIQSYLLSAAAIMALSGPAMATELNITCRCVVGGVNSGMAEWIENKVIPAFTAKMKAEGKDVTVKLNQFGGEDEQLTQQLALDFSTGAGPDVSGFDGFLIPSFVQGGLLKSLEEVAGADVNAWEGWSHISDGTKALMSYQGKPYGIALGTDARMIFVRKDLFQKAGLDAATWQPKSWDELLDAARKIKAAAPDSFPLQLNAGVSMGEATTMQGYWMALLGTGEQVTDDAGKYIVSSQGILDTLKLYKTIYVDDKLGDQRAQLLADGRNRTFANFRDGKTAMLVEGDWFYRSVTAPDAEFAVADRDNVMTWKKMPAAQPGKGLRGQDFVTMSGGTGFVINPHTDAPKESWELLSFMNSQEQLTAFQEIQPAIRIRNDVTIPNSPFLTETAEVLLPITTARPNDANYNKVSTEIQRMTESVVSGELSPEDAMAQYKAAVIAIVGEENTVSRL